MVEYKEQCIRCKKYYNREELVVCFGDHVCKKCLLIKKITESNHVNIPDYLMKKYGWKFGMELKLVPEKDGIKIIKHGG